MRCKRLQSNRHSTGEVEYGEGILAKLYGSTMYPDAYGTCYYVSLFAYREGFHRGQDKGECIRGRLISSEWESLSTL